jgi:hypothetical protein
MLHMWCYIYDLRLRACCETDLNKYLPYAIFRLQFKIFHLFFQKRMSQEFFGLKGHGNKADFLGFLQKSVRHRSLTVPFEPFRFWLRIRGNIRNRKMTPRLSELAFQCLKEKPGESESGRLPDSDNQGAANSPSQRVIDSPTRQVGESPWWVRELLFKFFKI